MSFFPYLSEWLFDKETSTPSIRAMSYQVPTYSGYVDLQGFQRPLLTEQPTLLAIQERKWAMFPALRDHHDEAYAISGRLRTSALPIYGTDLGVYCDDKHQAVVCGEGVTRIHTEYRPKNCGNTDLAAKKRI